MLSCFSLCSITCEKLSSSSPLLRGHSLLNIYVLGLDGIIIVVAHDIIWAGLTCVCAVRLRLQELRYAVVAAIYVGGGFLDRCPGVVQGGSWVVVVVAARAYSGSQVRVAAWLDVAS